MEEMTLETKKFPEITFRSSHIERIADGQWKVDGDSCPLHGVTKAGQPDRKANRLDSWTRHTVLKQTDFGIRPIKTSVAE